MEFKLSFYNIVVQENADKVVIWNTKKGSVVELEQTVWSKLKNGDFEDKNIQPLLKALQKEGIVVVHDLDEVEEIIFRAKLRQFSNSQTSFGLVIAPTLSCNYHCPYCFEGDVKKQKEIMSAEVIDSIITALKDKFNKNKQIKHLRITWFGGEPLLTYDKVMVPLLEQVITLCKDKNIDFRSSIITNGYFLTEDKFEFLFLNHNVKYVQITFDGTEKEYALRKGTTVEAYHRVIKNILSLSQYLFSNNINAKIAIRLNVDNENYQDIKKFVTILRSNAKFHDNITFNLARLRQYDFCEELDSFSSTDEYEDILYDFENFTNKKTSIIEPKMVFCGQHCMNVFSVGPHGELYKCEHDFGIKEHAVGNISTGLNYNKYFAEFMYQPLPEKCLRCQILPVCMGGCPHRRLMLKQNIECEHTIDHLKRSVIRYLKGGETNESHQRS